jgi:outer membrane receptor for Fe3+-dicitrate
MVFQPFGTKESRRKRYGLDQYRIQKVDRYEDATIISTSYYIQQMTRSWYMPSKTKWKDLEELLCGMGDCCWHTKYYSTLEEAEKAVNKMRTGDPFVGTKEETVKYIP